MPTDASSRAYSSARVRSGADVVVLEEDRAAAVAALDRAIQVVPLVDPAQRRRRRFGPIQRRQVVAQRDLAQKREGAVECAARAVAGDDQRRQTPAGCVTPSQKPSVLERRRRGPRPLARADSVQRAHVDRAADRGARPERSEPCPCHEPANAIAPVRPRRSAATSPSPATTMAAGSGTPRPTRLCAESGALAQPGVATGLRRQRFDDGEQQDEQRAMRYREARTPQHMQTSRGIKAATRRSSFAALAALWRLAVSDQVSSPTTTSRRSDGRSTRRRTTRGS